MSATTVILATEGVLLALAIIFVLALLRSHAEIPRRLVALEDPRAKPRPVPSASGASTVARDLVRLVQLAPSGHEVVMSSAAWREYQVEATPHFVLVDSSTGAIAGRGSAVSWEQLVALVEQAAADVALAAAESTTSGRAARAEEALARSGISPGHASLYASRTASGDGGHA